MKKYPGLLFSLFGIAILSIEFFVGLPILLYFITYGTHSLFIFEIMNSVGNSFIMNFLGFLSPTTRLYILSIIAIFSLAIIGIFSHKKRGYKILTLISWLLLFGGVLFLVLKTYNYIPNFFASIIAGTILIAGGFASRYSCFWGYRKRKFYPYRIPLLIWITSFAIFCGILTLFPGPVQTLSHSISMGPVEEVIVMAPWTLDIKEFIFAGLFLMLLGLCRFGFVNIYSFPLSSQQKYTYQRKLLRAILILGSISLRIFLGFQKSLFTSPDYDFHKYDSILVKSGYQQSISTGSNVFYLQNNWLISHTGFLNKIESEEFVRLNYFSQGGFVSTGFSPFWDNFSGGFHAEFTDISNISSLGYNMVNLYAADLPFPEEKIRERTHLASSVAINLCKQGHCKEGFSYREQRAIFTQNRLNAGQGLIGTLISLVAMQDMLSGAQELLPYLSLSQKQQIVNILVPFDVDTIFTNSMVQEYHFVYSMGVENIKRYMDENNASAPKFIIDLDHTDAQMKEYFAKAILDKGKNPEFNYEEGFSLSYNIIGNSLVSSLLPRVSNVYDRLISLEQHRNSLVEELNN